MAIAPCSLSPPSGNMAVACTIRRNKRSFYRRVHIDKLATPHSLNLMNVISRLYGDTMPLSNLHEFLSSYMIF